MFEVFTKILFKFLRPNYIISFVKKFVIEGNHIFFLLRILHIFSATSLIVELKETTLHINDGR